jgi:hypothetical protein
MGHLFQRRRAVLCGRPPVRLPFRGELRGFLRAGIRGVLAVRGEGGLPADAEATVARRNEPSRREGREGGESRERLAYGRKRTPGRFHAWPAAMVS